MTEINEVTSEDSTETTNDQMQIGTYNLVGVRTFILALVALLGYLAAGYFGLSGEFLSGTKELALIGFAFFFVKTVGKSGA